MQIDSDKDGILSCEQFYELVTKLNLGLEHSKIDEMCKEIAQDGGKCLYGPIVQLLSRCD